MKEPTQIDLGAMIREKLSQDQIDRLQFFDPSALRAFERAIGETPMPDAWRNNLQGLVQQALNDQGKQGAMQGVLHRLGEWMQGEQSDTPEHIPTLAEKPWTEAELAAAEAFTAAMGAAGYEQFAMGDGCGRLMHCIRAALMAASRHE